MSALDRQIVGTVRAVAAAQTVLGASVNVLVIETTEPLAGIELGQVHRVRLSRLVRKLVRPAPTGRACGLRRHRDQEAAG